MRYWIYYNSTVFSVHGMTVKYGSISRKNYCALQGLWLSSLNISLLEVVFLQMFIVSQNHAETYFAST